MERLAAVVQRTYENTQDCAFVQGLRSIDDVLAGYKAVGNVRSVALVSGLCD